MNDLENAIVESKIETAQNEVRSIHNELESKRTFGKKNYLSYDSSKFINMIKMCMGENN